MSDYSLSDVACLDISKNAKPISTGIGFFDHMIDQLNSHAQIGVSVTVGRNVENGGTSTSSDANRYAEPLGNQEAIMAQVGAAIGKELNKIIYAQGSSSHARTSRFCCPLDEALVECQLVKHAASAEGKLVSFTLPPYGKYPAGKGRSRIGTMATRHVQQFFAQLAKSSGVDISLVKLRGDNGHHVVESAFKAFSRAMRNLIDGTDTSMHRGMDKRDHTSDMQHSFEKFWGASSESHAAGLALAREGKIARSTKETSISVDVKLASLPSDSENDGITVDTGIKTMDQFLLLFAQEAKISLVARCKGDLHVDDHHTSEDVSIALGQALNAALGTKAGLNRMWCSVAKYGDAEVEVTMDLSNRPCLVHNLSLSANPNGEEFAGDLSVEMVDHILESLVMNLRASVHVVEKRVGNSVLETTFATAIAFGRSLGMCAAVDPRRAGKTASSKGTLSV